jgi:hypothetical protein
MSDFKLSFAPNLLVGTLRLVGRFTSATIFTLPLVQN